MVSMASKSLSNSDPAFEVERGIGGEEGGENVDMEGEEGAEVEEFESERGGEVRTAGFGKARVEFGDELIGNCELLRTPFLNTLPGSFSVLGSEVFESVPSVFPIRPRSSSAMLCSFSVLELPVS